MNMPVNTQIKPQKVPVIHWGVHFLEEDVVTDYGPGEGAKTAAEETVHEWADSPYPAELVSQVILPWSSDKNTKVPLIVSILDARSDPQAVIRLREWLTENDYDNFDNPMADPKTRFKQQVPFVKKIRREANLHKGLEELELWLATHGYLRLSSDEAIELLRAKLSTPMGRVPGDNLEDDGHNIKLDFDA